MSTPFLPLAEPWFPAECADAVRAQVASGFVGPGAATKAFADAIASWAGVRHCHLTTSGTVALTVAAHAVGLRPGDEILIPAYGVISTINGFASAGLEPRLVDIDRVTGCIDDGALETAVTPRTRAVCFVNFSGYTGDNVVRVRAWCDRRGLPLIEDAACALGQRHERRSAGSFGTIGTYSFSVPKVLTTGQGGAIVSADPVIADRAGAYIDQGDLEWRRTNLNREVGTNLRFNDVSAALGLPQMEALAARLERRREAHAALRALLGEHLYSVPGDQAPLHNIVFTTDGERLVERLRRNGIAAVQQYRTVSQHPPYRALADRPFENADFWTAHAVYLPFGMAMTPDDSERVGRAVLDSGVNLLVPANR
jgi:perosamine synthetase